MPHKPVAVFPLGGAAGEGSAEVYPSRAECGDEWLARFDGGTSPASEHGKPCEEAVRSLRRVGLEQRFLAQIGEAFASSLDSRETLRTVAHMAAGSIADLSIIGMVRDDGTLEMLAVEDADSGQSDGSVDLPGVSLGETPSPLIAEALREDEVRVVSDLESVGSDPLVASLKQVGAGSLIVAPMVARGQRLGVIVLASRQARVRYGRRAAELAGELARRAALAADNARLYEEARRAIRARDQMLAVVAHDLRNPLGVISMTADVIRGLDASEASPVTERLEMIRRSARQMDRLIQDLLDVTRSEAGRLRLDRAAEDPAEIVHEAAELLRPLTERAGHTLVCTVEPGLPEVEMDRRRILQALGNLVGNAVKFTPAGGRITIRAQRTDDGVRFSVQDTGSGIPSHQLPHLFDRFWQLRGTDRRGLGLGLAIVKGIAEAHQGRVRAESTPGRGTSISITVPRGT